MHVCAAHFPGSTLALHLCHAPTPVVVFELLIERCGTTEHFLFTNTYVHGLHLNIRYLVYFSSPSIIISLYTNEHPYTFIIHNNYKYTTQLQQYKGRDNSLNMILP